jgi:predicted metal-dependent HD superfamily phosphohydrolase
MLRHAKKIDPELALSIALHDVFYNSVPEPPGINEYQSARFARIKITEYDSRPIEEAIIATAFYDKNQTFLSPLAQEICDLDLCNLALDYDSYCYWSELALEEAKIIFRDFVKDPLGFKYGQIIFCSKMLQREKLYYIHSEWEQPARENMTRRIAELQEGLENDERVSEKGAG